jgi:hypothetical protein
VAHLVRVAAKSPGAQPRTIASDVDNPESIVVRGGSVDIAATFAGRLYRYALCDGTLHMSLPTENPGDLALMGDYVYVSQTSRILRFAP